MASLHYQLHVILKHGHESRFKLIISTLQQQEAAWHYGHQNQILLDLTFGFSSSHVLLGICYDLFIFPYLILSRHLGTTPRPGIHHDPACRMAP